MYTVSQAFAVQLPSLAELADSNRAGAEAVSRRLAAHAQLVLLPFALCCALGSEQLVRLVYGGAFHGAAQAMIPALAVLPLAPLSAQAGQVAALRLQPMRWLVATALGAATFVGVAALAVPAHGATGATLALLAAMAAAIVGAAVALPRCFGRPGLVAGLGGAALVLGCLALL